MFCLGMLQSKGFLTPSVSVTNTPGLVKLWMDAAQLLLMCFNLIQTSVPCLGWVVWRKERLTPLTGAYFTQNRDTYKCNQECTENKGQSLDISPTVAYVQNVFIYIRFIMNLLNQFLGCKWVFSASVLFFFADGRKITWYMLGIWTLCLIIFAGSIGTSVKN